MWYDCQLWNTSFQTSKHFFSKTVGSAADLMVQFYRAKIALTDESEEKREVTNIEIDGDDQLWKVVMFAQYIMSVLSCHLCDSRMLQNK